MEEAISTTKNNLFSILKIIKSGASVITVPKASVVNSMIVDGLIRWFKRSDFFTFSMEKAKGFPPDVSFIERGEPKQKQIQSWYKKAND